MDGFLNLAEKKLRLNLRAHLKNGAYLMVGAVAGLISNLAIAVAFANLLPASIFGTYRYIRSLIDVVGSFSLTQSSTVITRSVARGHEGAWKEGARQMLLWSVFPLLIGLVLSGYYFYQDNILLALSVAIASILAPLMKIARLYSSFLNGKQEYAETAKTQIVRSLVPTITLVLAAFFFDSVIYLVTVFYLSYVLIDILISLYVYFKFRPNSITNESDYSYSIHLSGMNLLSTGANHIDKILLFQFVGATELALYAVATAIPQQVNLITNGIKTLLMPKISNQSFAALRRNLHKRSFQVSILLFLLLLLYIVSAPYIFTYLFPKYVDGILLSQVYAVGAVLSYGMPYRLALTAHSKTKELYYISVSMSVIKIALTFILVLNFGLWGAVISVVLSSMIKGALSIAAFYSVRI